MKYRYEYNGNTEYVTLHLTEALISCDFLSKFASNATAEDNFRLGLFEVVKGVTDITLRRYSVTAKRGAAFDRDAILDSLLEIARMIFSWEESWTALPTLRSDINYHMCEQCVAERNREAAIAMRDFDALDY
jgi:hypothetical protein